MILIRAVIFLSVIFDQQLKITFRKSPPPSPFYSFSPLNSEIVSLLHAKYQNFLAPPAERAGGGHCVSKSLIKITGNQFICLISVIPTWA